MKRPEKFTEMAAFAQAFGGRPEQRVSSPLARPPLQQASSGSRPLGRPSGSGPKLRAPSSSAASWTPAPGQPLRRSTSPKPAQPWNTDDDLDDEEEEWDAGAARRRPAPPAPEEGGRISSVLVSIILVSVALLAAYSLQSHSRRHYIPGTVSDATVSNVSFDAGWPLTYAHVNAQQAPLADVDPVPAIHYISPVSLAIDVLFLAVPFWLLLEAVWQFWVFVLARLGPRRLTPRLITLGLTTLVAALWMVAALGVGIFFGFNGGQLSGFPIYLLPVLVPAIPGFGLAGGISIVLGVPPTLWHLDFGVFLLVMAMPLALLTICLYAIFGLIGRALRSASNGPAQ